MILLPIANIINYKYTKLYSGGVPEFIEGDVFKTIIPLTREATSTVGPATPQDATQDTTQDRVKKAVYAKILEFCIEPKSKSEIAEYFQLRSAKEFGKRYLKPLLESGKLEMTMPEKPTSKYQKYVTKK